MRTATEEGHETHLSVLNTLAFKHVLEFGVGAHSTPFFIERAESLHSVETDDEWFIWAAAAFADAENFTIGRTRPRTLAKFDLVLIDDGQTPGERIDTLTWVLSRKQRPTTVLHDAEVKEYRAVLDATGFPYELRCDETPCTAVIP